MSIKRNFNIPQTKTRRPRRTYTDEFKNQWIS